MMARNFKLSCNNKCLRVLGFARQKCFNQLVNIFCRYFVSCTVLCLIKSSFIGVLSGVMDALRKLGERSES